MIQLAAPSIASADSIQDAHPGSSVQFCQPIEAEEELARQPGWSEPLGDSIPEWASAIKWVCESESLSMIEKSSRIHAARMALKYGKWAKLFAGEDRPPFSKKQGEKRALVGEIWGPLARLEKW